MENSESQTSLPNLTVIEKELFTERAISVSTFLGGPLAAVYLIAKNFKALDKDEEARKVWYWGIALILIYFIILFSIPQTLFDSPLPKLMYSIWTIPAFLIVRKYQQSDIKMQLDAGVRKAAGWKAFLYSLIAAAITILFVVIISLILFGNDVFDNSEYEQLASTQMSYSGCTVYYDSINVKVIDARVIGTFLEEMGYFRPDQKDMFATVLKSGDLSTISIYIDHQYINNADVTVVLKLVITKLEELYKNEHFQFNLIGIDPMGNEEERIVKL